MPGVDPRPVITQTCDDCQRLYAGDWDHHVEIYHDGSPTLDELWDGPEGRAAWARADRNSWRRGGATRSRAGMMHTAPVTAPPP